MYTATALQVSTAQPNIVVLNIPGFAPPTQMPTHHLAAKHPAIYCTQVVRIESSGYPVKRAIPKDSMVLLQWPKSNVVRCMVAE